MRAFLKQNRECEIGEFSSQSINKSSLKQTIEYFAEKGQEKKTHALAKNGKHNKADSIRKQNERINFIQIREGENLIREMWN